MGMERGVLDSTTVSRAGRAWSPWPQEQVVELFFLHCFMVAEVGKAPSRGPA